MRYLLQQAHQSLPAWMTDGHGCRAWAQTRFVFGTEPATQFDTRRGLEPRDRLRAHLLQPAKREHRSGMRGKNGSNFVRDPREPVEAEHRMLHKFPCHVFGQVGEIVERQASRRVGRENRCDRRGELRHAIDEEARQPVDASRAGLGGQHPGPLLVEPRQA